MRNQSSGKRSVRLGKATAAVVYGDPVRKFFASLTLFAISTITYASVWRGAESAEILKESSEMERHHDDRRVAQPYAIRMWSLCTQFEDVRRDHFDLHTFLKSDVFYAFSTNEDLNDWLARLDSVRLDTAKLVAEFRQFRSDVDVPQLEAPEAKIAQEFQKQHSEWHLQRLASYQAQQVIWFKKKEPDSRDPEHPLKAERIKADDIIKKREDFRREEYKRRFDNWNRTHNHNSKGIAGRRESLSLQNTYAGVAWIYLIGWGIFAVISIALMMRTPKAVPVRIHRRSRKIAREAVPSDESGEAKNSNELSV